MLSYPHIPFLIGFLTLNYFCITVIVVITINLVFMAIKIKILVMIKFILGFVLNGFEFQKKKPRIDLRNHLND